ncbi:catabolic L-serine/threonine dehydratase, partial [Oleoguttula sp. CCFEE 5521]
ILAMETKGADALNVSLRAGELTTLPGITSQATSLGAVRVAERAYEIAKEGEASGRVVSAVLSDAEAAMGCWRFADDERMLVELACGVNLALCYGGRLEKALGRPVHKDETVVIVVCGGSNVNTEMLANWRLEHGHLNDEGVTNGVVPSGKTAPNGA